MFLTEYDEEKILAQERQEVSSDMLKKALPLQLIEEISQLSEDAIRSIALNLQLRIDY